MRSKVLLVYAFFVLLILPDQAFAYIGPGAGLSAIGSLLALVAGVGLALVGFVWFPLKRLRRQFQHPNASTREDPRSK